MINDHNAYLTLGCYHQNPGLSVAVVKDGRVEIAEGFGFADLSSRRQTKNTTLFGLASLTRSFSSLVLLKLLKDHNLTVFTRPADILGNEFRFKDDERNRYATIRDLLAHTLGIASHNWMRFDPTLTRSNLKSRIRYFDAIKPFRTAFVTNNLMYGVITEIVEKLSGKTWEENVKEILYDPIGMTTSKFLTKVSQQADDIATGYSPDDETGDIVVSPFAINEFWGELCGSTCVMSNAVDMAKWMNFHLSGGKSMTGTQVYDGDMLKSSYKAHNMIVSSTMKTYFTQPKVPVTNSVSLPILTHTGTTWGYTSKITLIPDKNIGIFTALSGQDDHFIYRTTLHNYLSDVYLDILPYLNKSSVCSYPQPWFPKPPQKSEAAFAKNLTPTHTLQTYTGKFANQPYGSLSFTVNNTANRLMMEYGIGKWLLYPQSKPNEFAAEGIGIINKLLFISNIVFQENNGLIDRVKITDFEFNDPPIFHRDSPVKGNNINIVG
ncbi:hypothetical protein KUTeg_012619 [Tegillarca granosa]|uniref:Beta-lactamase-related domain-containing protein n=1 Tax=Tegillarca granosa TaxID=220873 RepID=A0ABQ9F098_TEGGR|nr:hypothetical protein KUTeg_012619 [Tegillarca granosa]